MARERVLRALDVRFRNIEVDDDRGLSKSAVDIGIDNSLGLDRPVLDFPV